MPKTKGRKPAAKAKAPVSLTGGQGFRSENPVAARFLLDLISGTNTLGADFGRVVRVDWQTRDAGWLIDDLVVTCVTANGTERAACVSVKTHEQLGGGGFSTEFTQPAWMQWLGRGTTRVFRQGADAIVLATGGLDRNVGTAWTALQTQAAAVGANPERLAARLISGGKPRDGAQSSQTQLAIFQSLERPVNLGPEVDRAERVRFMRDIRVLHFDLRNPNASDVADAILVSQRSLTSGNAAEARQLWERLVGIADEMRPLGGSLDLPGLLGILRSEFRLREHPDYVPDWSMLARRSAESASDIDEQIGGQSIDRTLIREALETALVATQVQFLVGESGSGKSALAKQVAASAYPRLVWLTANNLDHASETEFADALGLTHPLIQILRATPDPCLVVLDGAEGYSPNAGRLAGRLIASLVNGSAVHVHVLATMQFEAVSVVMREFARHGAPESGLVTFSLSRPLDADIDGLLDAMPQLGWMAHRPELRPLLSNLKVFDLAARSLRSEGALGGQPVRGLTSLIDLLWTDWAGEGAGGLGRTHILQTVAAGEADNLSTGVPRHSLGYAEQQGLPPLQQAGLIRVRDERVVFSHDLIGDWARLRILVGDSPLSSPANRQRVRSPRWQRAVRLFGQRILEHSDDGLDQWRRVVEDSSDTSEDAVLVRDLFLEALFLATNAAQLLERAWPALIANQGALLKRLLHRFLFVATLPDARLLALAEGFDPQEVEHAFRIPSWPYWAPMLSVLHTHADEVVQLAPTLAARVSALWLRTMPAEILPGYPMPWRREAAELAHAVARETQAKIEEDRFWGGSERREVFEAALYAARDLPQETAGLFLELTKRRDLSPTVAARVEASAGKRTEERRADAKRSILRPALEGAPRGRRRQPWPDGPRSSVERGVRDACLDGAAFASLAHADPSAALEVLLAVCIEAPKHDDYMASSSAEDYGLAFWDSHQPPMFFRGPFLQLLRQAPEQGLTFVIKLINFATARAVAPGRFGVMVKVDGQPKLWLGDNRMFRWHHDWPTMHGSTLHSALMALERWLYEQIEQGDDVAWAVRRIVHESESVAFAGLLLDVGKRHALLFADVLRPLFSAWIFWEWDWSVTLLRANGLCDMLGYWDNQPAQVIRLGREWYAMPHRRVFLLSADGPLARDYFSNDEHRPFFAAVRADWRRRLAEANEDTGHLRLMIERLDPANYTFPSEGEDGEITFAWPAEIARLNAASLRQLAEQQTLTTLPRRCRQILDAAQPLSDDQLEGFLDWLQSIEARQPAMDADGEGEPIQRLEAVVIGGVAVLVVLHLNWLNADPARIAWCRAKLLAVTKDPPPTARFDSELSGGSYSWGVFAAECGVALLSHDHSDLLARKLVALGVTDFHYETTAITMGQAFAVRSTLGEEFWRLAALTLHWAALRAVDVRDPGEALRAENVAWPGRKEALVDEFVEGRLAAELPDIVQLNRDALAERDALQKKRFPEYLGRGQRRGHGGGRREKLYPEMLGLDGYVVTSGFAWLDISSASTQEERTKWLGVVRAYVAIVLNNQPAVDDAVEQEIDGLPGNFDSWVFARASETIVAMSPLENPASLWQPVLELGPPSHQWIERFYWTWFTDGLRAAPSIETFVALWRAMIEYALTCPQWDFEAGGYHLGTMVFELLGFDGRWGALGQNAGHAAAVGSLSDVFAAAASKWFRMERVLRGFLNFVVQPAAAHLLVPSLGWLPPIVATLRDYDWRDGVEEALVDYLRHCWQRESGKIAGDAPMRQQFLSLLAAAVARGSHAAIALRDRVAGSGLH